MALRKSSRHPALTDRRMIGSSPLPFDPEVGLHE
jgi:hypothetical protein